MSQYGARGMALDGYTSTQIVQHYYTGTTVAPYRDDMDIRVNLLHRVKTVYLRSQALVAGGGAVEVTVAGGKPVLGTTSDVFAVKAGTGKVTVTRTRAGVTTTVGTGTSVTVRWAGTRTPGTAGAGATVLNVAKTVAGLSTSGHRYRYGTLDVATTAAAPTKLEVVNQLRLHDEYLLGIAEISSSWPTASLQAQVLASRSYALARYASGLRAGCRCHVDDGGGPYWDQTFVGNGKVAGAGGANWRAAVASTLVTATTGKAILSGGRPITAFYFAASGGRTQASQNVWVSALPYAASVDDHWSMDPSVPWSRWTPRVRSQALVAAAFGLPNVVRVDVSKKLPSGAVSTATAWSSSGTSSTIRGETLRSKLSLPSTWVSRIIGG